MVTSCRRVVVFDLDDTLYLERDYVKSGFKAVAARIAGSDSECERWFDFLWSGFLDGVRGNAFDRLLNAYPELSDRETVASLAAAYRTHRPEIALHGSVKQLLDRLRALGVPIALISDGALESQKRKVEALKLEHWFDCVVLTDAWGREFWKPAQRAFIEVAERLGSAGSSLIYVSDNPEKDFVAPNQLGWNSLRLRVSGQLRSGLEPPDMAHAPRWEADSVTDMVEVIERFVESEK